jgi:hypothetical protein
MPGKTLALVTLTAALAALPACTHHRAEHAMAAGDSGFTYAEPGALPSAAPEGREPITRYADANRDGRVTREEAQADPALARSFDQHDGNKDGELDRAEFARLEAQSRGARAAFALPPDSLAPLSAGPAGYGLEVGPAAATGSPSLNRTGVDEVRPQTPD